jgi:hypothetical protein
VAAALTCGDTRNREPVVRSAGGVDHGGTRGEEAEMGSEHERRRRRGGIQTVIRLVMLGLAVTAVVKELRTPAEERTWNGVVAGFVPYDFRRPTLDRFRERMWNPEGEHVIGPRVFGVGWTVNVGRLVALVRKRVSGTD